MLLLNALVLLAVAATVPAATVPTARTPQPTKSSSLAAQRGPKCIMRADSIPLCPKGDFCDYRDEYCYPRRNVGEVCPIGSGVCIISKGYCRFERLGDDLGVCTAYRKVGQECAGPSEDYCEDSLICLRPEGTDEDAVGKCVASPRSKGETCNGDADCGKQGYCKKAHEKLRLGVCAQRVGLNAECSGAYGDHVAPSCADDLACFVKDEDGNKGVCVKQKGGLGNKCNVREVFCDEKQALFCKFVSGKYYGECRPQSKMGEKCSADYDVQPCAESLSCYVEDDKSNGVCHKNFGNPLGAKCTDIVNCTDGAYCHFFDGKKYGTCEKNIKH